MESDESLVLATLNGNKYAFESLYTAYVQRIYKYVYYRMHQHEATEDIVSQTFLNAFTNLASFNVSKGTFSAWLHRIAHNLIVDYWRSHYSKQSIQDAWDLPSEDDVAEYTNRTVELDRVRPLLAKLGQRQRTIVLLRIWQDRPFAEIAEIVGATEAACKMSYKRAIQIVKNTLLFLLFIPVSFLYT
jgi:RNA polymerase sigma-70 factor, ECF subfamily